MKAAAEEKVALARAQAARVEAMAAAVTATALEMAIDARAMAAAAKVAAAASVSAVAEHAVALVFVNQTVVVGGGAPSGTASSVRVTLDKVGDRWLVSGFDPV